MIAPVLHQAIDTLGADIHLLGCLPDRQARLHQRHSLSRARWTPEWRGVCVGVMHRHSIKQC